MHVLNKNRHAIPVLCSRYELGEIIGEGAVGRVYAARDTLLCIDVAVKVMHDAYVCSERAVERFRQEARLAARMLSPHVVKVLGLAVTKTGAPCIVYERLHGETLATRVEREGPLGLADTAEIVGQIAQALARAHAIGVVHRDVKPANVLLVEAADGRPFAKLLDFGIAEIAERPHGAVSGELVGTPEYIAPEVLFRSHHPDARVDLYALGVLAFECLTARCPFPGETVDDVLYRLTVGVRPTLAELRPDVPPEVDAWMERALAPDPFWRFPTARELAGELRDAVGGARRRRAPCALDAA